MALGTLRLIRRALSAAVALIGIALVVVALQGGDVRLLVTLLLAPTLATLMVVWRKELAANEAAFAERERAQLTMMRVQLELSKKKREGAETTTPKPSG